MKISFKFYSVLGTFLTVQMMASTSNARPFDLVRYDEFGGTTAFALKTDEAGISQITLFTCPKDTKIADLSECTEVLDLLPADELNTFIKQSLQSWSVTHLNGVLKPLSAQDIAVFGKYYYAKFSPQAQSAATQLTALREELAKVRDMRSIMPSSEAYKKREKAALDSIHAIETSISLTPQIITTATKVEEVIDQLSKSLLNLIAKNNAQGTPNFYSKSMMTGTLLDKVITDLTSPSNPSYATFKGQRYSAKKVKAPGSGSRYEVYNAAGEALVAIDTKEMPIMNATRDRFAIFSLSPDHTSLEMHFSSDGQDFEINSYEFEDFKIGKIDSVTFTAKLTFEVTLSSETNEKMKLQFGPDGELKSQLKN